METAARYREDKIKTYGFETKADLCIGEFTLGSDQFKRMNHARVDSSNKIIPFEMVFMGAPDGYRYRLSMVVSRRHQDALKRLVIDMNPLAADSDWRFIAPVELIYFFGPHFGDRCGIANFTCRALAENNIFLIASAFSSSSIFLVLPEHCALKAKAVFSNLFEIPKTIQRPSYLSVGRHNSRHNKGRRN